ncbi:MAG TPA: hypothetical protein VKR41_08990 [Puia sp.]|nr:hypothetical protein [Puia sp.]
MKRSFAGPAWLLLIFGLIEGVFAWGVLQLISELYLPRGGTPLISAATIVYTVMWPVILLLEALTYWLIRRRNKMKFLSWTHAVILSFAFVLHDSVFILTILHSPLVGGMHTRGGRNVEAGMYWGLIVLAHAAFVQVLILAFRKPEPVRKEGGGMENILDDVIL